MRPFAETGGLGNVAKAIAFTFYAPESKVIKVGGDFNKWKTAKLKSAKTGIWSTSLKLKPGRYEYRFVVDQIPVLGLFLLECKKYKL